MLCDCSVCINIHRCTFTYICIHTTYIERKWGMDRVSVYSRIRKKRRQISHFHNRKSLNNVKYLKINNFIQAI